MSTVRQLQSANVLVQTVIREMRGRRVEETPFPEDDLRRLEANVKMLRHGVETLTRELGMDEEETT